MAHVTKTSPPSAVSSMNSLRVIAFSLG
jgi:hypothetical protein